MAAGWSLRRGATALEDGSVRFSVWAPKVDTASVLVTQGGHVSEHPLEPCGGGVLEVTVQEIGRGADYFYRLDDDRNRPDPVSRCQPEGVHGPSRVVDPLSFDWSDADWQGLRVADLLLYEIHIGTFTAAGTFEAAIERLPYLRDLGVTAIELMPVAQFPGRRNWGYDGASPYAPQYSYGGPDGLRRLVNAAHAADLAVYLDVVYNHLGPEGNYLAEFGPYFTNRYTTPWGLAINFDGPDSDEVRRYFIDNALYWITEYHIDGLRLDAVQAIYDFGARHILEELSTAVHHEAARLNRQVHVIAESDLNDPRLVRERANGGYGLDAIWNDDYQHAVHAKLTGERAGYYIDYGSLSSVGKALSDRFVLDGCYSEFRRRRHGATAVDVPANRFVVFIQNHDQVGNRAFGERLDALVSFERRKLAAAFLLLAPYVPLLFMGEEYGETRPFLYFVDHGDPDLIEAVREGRQREFAGFEWKANVPDPGSEETFLRSKLDPGIAKDAPHAQLLQLYRDLIRIRRSEPLLKPGFARWRTERNTDADCIAVVLGDANQALACFNFNEGPASWGLRLGAGRWRRHFTSEDTRYGGAGAGSAQELVGEANGVARLVQQGHTATFYVREVD